jgi:tetratricopeptide (TPR) repeat protein
MAPKLNHEVFARRDIFPPALRAALAAAVVVALAAAVAFNWDALTRSDEERFQEAYDQGDIDGALALAAKLVADNPSSARAQIGLAAAYIQRALAGREVAASVAAARGAATRATELDAEDPDGWRTLGYTYELEGDAETAAGYYARAVALQPMNAAALVQLGQALAASGQGAEAEAYLERAVAADSYDPQARLLLAQARLSRGDEDTYAIEKLLEPVFGSGVPLLVADAKATVVAIRLAEGADEAAEKLAREAVGDAPDSVPALLALGEALYSSVMSRQLPWDATMAEVRALAGRAAEIAPTRAAAPYLAFRAASATGDAAGAARYAERALALLAADPTLSPSARVEMAARIEFLQTVKVTITR